MLKQNVKSLFRVLSILLILFFIIEQSSAQVSTFSEIKEIFLRERPQTGDPYLREQCFMHLDSLIVDTYPRLLPETKEFYRVMLEKALLEIKSEAVTEGATIWLIYNHGFVVKTPSVTIGFDLYNYFGFEEFLELANLIDVYFISHPHPDHFSEDMIDEMKSLGKPVVGPTPADAGFTRLITIGMEPDTDHSININDVNLHVTAHDGDHSPTLISMRQYEITTPEGFKVLHSGDNKDQSLPVNVTDVDVYLLNIYNARCSNQGIECSSELIRRIKPKVTLSGHMMELLHLQYNLDPKPYHYAFEVNDGNLGCDYYVLGWGERYHFDDSSNDSISPNSIENLSLNVQSDTIIVSWDIPSTASDGDTASFFRVIVNDAEDFLVTEQNFDYVCDATGTYTFKVYAYDDCGNQSESYAEIDVPITVVYVETSLPKQSTLRQNYPNPFNSTTTIEYSVPCGCRTSLKIYNASGQLVATLKDEITSAGRYFVVWDASGMPSGIYFCTLKSGDFVQTKEMLFLK